MSRNSLSNEEKIRYARHLNIPEIGEAGQCKLKAASVLIVGAGGLGSASSIYLAAAGIGRIGIIDSDFVELSNLQRQILHDTVRIGMAKVESARKRLAEINPEIEIDVYQERVSVESDKSLFKDYPIILDASDNFDTRYVLNEVCVKEKKIFIYGAIFQFYGQMSVFDATRGPCFRCVFQKIPSEEFAKANQGIGVVGALPGTIGTMQAIEAIKLILEIGEPSIGRLILYDGMDMRFQEIQTRKDPACPVCGTR
ncbi:MAG TPA: molybdopterin-synthase adenylyltransferase MoeB [Pelolinea sp.]|jgi:molybdopterin/thiamine biosynthesis adenylyltransferase|nr:molybdopterin-synthase adenylyltransferase MoeB [Pelolinea sp.]